MGLTEMYRESKKIFTADGNFLFDPCKQACIMKLVSFVLEESNMFEFLINKLKAHPRKIVFTEGTDPRVLEASARLLSGTFLTPVLVGDPEEIQKVAEEIGFNIRGAEIINPATFEDMEKMVAELTALRKGKVTEEQARELLKLAQASQAGVPVIMNVRGICCLRPGVPGLTDHIKVFSIVGRFLEHPRIYAFGVGEETKLYIGSADLMTRNTERRVEIACPVLDPSVRRQIRHYVELYCFDNVKARVLQPDGSYTRVERPEGAPAVDAQAALMEEAEREALAAVQAPPVQERKPGLLARLFGRREK